MFKFWRTRRTERAGFELYGAAVAAARDPWFYTRLGVPDTLDGRFDMVGVHAWLLIHQLRKRPAPGPDVAQAVFDAMFSDMDINLREMGVGDLSVGKKVKQMWEAFHGRAVAYEAALADSDVAPLTEALRRNVWRGAPLANGATDGAAELAAWVRAQDATLAGQDTTAFAAGHVTFLRPAAVPPEVAAA